MAAQDEFAPWARGYERDGLAGVLLRQRLWALSLLDLNPGDHFLDVGCATGGAVRTASAIAGTAIGIDRSTGMIRHARRLTPQHDQAVFVIADAESLPFRAWTFTAVLCTSALRHFDDEHAAVTQIARVLRPGGRAVLGDFRTPTGRSRRGLHRPSRHADQHSLARALSLGDLNPIETTSHLTPFGLYVLVTATADRTNTAGRTDGHGE